MSNKKSNFRAGGYYIALVLCAAAIGISGYLYYRGSGEEVRTAQTEQVQQAQAGVPAAATRPGAVLPTEPEVPQTTQTPSGKPARTAAPVDGELVAPYSMECLSYNETTRDWRVHGGMDLAAEAGTPVKAAADGEVYTVYEDDRMGMTVVLRHQGGYTTHYASLAQDVPVKAGDKVTLGQTIGTVGTTALMESALGDHVCFRVTLNGDVIDPAEFLN